MVRKWTKRVIIFLAAIVILIAAFLLFLHTPWGRSLVRKNVVSYLSKKFQSTVYIGDIDYRLPDWIQLRDVIILDRHKDTLLKGGHIYARINMLGLLSNKVEIGGLTLERISLNAGRSMGDTVLNFQYIIDAFTRSSTHVDTSTNTSPLRLSVDHVLLNQVSLVFDDKPAKQFYAVRIGHLFCSPDDLDLQKSAYDFKQFYVSGAELTIIDSSAAPNNPGVTKDSPRQSIPSALNFAVSQIGLRDIRLHYFSASAKLDAAVFVDSLQIDQSSVNLQNQKLAARRVLLQNSSVGITLFEVPVKKTTNDARSLIEETAAKNDWELAIDGLLLVNNSIAYHNNAQPRVGGFDPNHLDVKNLSLASKQVKYGNGDISVVLDSGALLLNEQLNLHRLEGTAIYSKDRLQIEDVTAVLNRSVIQTTGVLIWPFNGKGAKENSHWELVNARINYADLLQFQPTLEKLLPISVDRSEQILVSGQFANSGYDFNVRRLQVSTASKKLFFSGGGNYNTHDYRYNVAINRLDARSSLLPAHALRELEKRGVNLPESVSLSGEVRGDARGLKTRMALTSLFGNMKVNGEVQGFDRPSLLHYTVTLLPENFATGKWFGQDSLMGPINGRIEINGRGTTLKTLNSRGSVQIESMEIAGYDYSGIDLDAILVDSAFKLKGTIDDPNLKSGIDIAGILSGGRPAFSGFLRVDSVNLHALKMSKDSIKISAYVSIDTLNTDLSQFLVALHVDSSRVWIGTKQLEADSVWINGNSNRENASFIVHTPFLHAALKTNFPFEELPAEFKQLGRRLSLRGDSVSTYPDHLVTVNGELNQHELITAFVPGLEIGETLSLQGHYAAARKDSFLFFLANAPSLTYRKMKAARVEVQAKNTDSAVRLMVTAANLISGSDTLTDPAIDALLQGNQLKATAAVNDKKGNQFYSVGASARREGEQLIFQLTNDITLNYHKWKVPAGNFLRVRKDGLVINDLVLSNRGQSISIRSKDVNSISPIDINIDSLDLGSLLAITSFNDTTMAGGKIDGSITIQQPIEKVPVFTGKLDIRNLEIRKTPVGDLNVHSASQHDSLAIVGSITGNNRLAFSGGIHPAKGSVDIDAQIQKLDIRLLQQFVSDYLSRLAGDITGNLQVRGTTGDPKLAGKIRVDSASFAVNELYALYRINKQEILIDYPVIRLNNFVMVDTLGHPLTINGSLNLRDPSAVGFDLKVDTKEFIVLSAPRMRKSKIYGLGILDADISIKGTANEPIIEGTALMRERSNISYVLASSATDYTRAEKGRIQFVDIDTLPVVEADTIAILIDTTVARKAYKGLKYNLNLELNKDARFSLIIDPATHDELVIKGAASLNAGLEQDGSMGLTGVYYLDSGYYNMNNQLLKGKFILKKGSTITFNGDPTEGIADVTTEYQIETTASGLVRTDDRQLTDNSSLSKRMPFMVVLNIKGMITKPDLSFDIKLKENAPGITGSLKTAVQDELALLREDVSKLNQQVFSLLVMNRFTLNSGQNLSSEINADAAVKEGMSRFISEAMNQVAADLIKGVDFNVNLNSYTTTGSTTTTTDLEMAVTKNLFKDRLMVSVGKNFVLGESPTYQNPAEQYIPDVTTTYKLSRDGRYLVKAYRKNEYDTVVEGYFAETGVSFTIEMDYARFKELIQRKK